LIWDDNASATLAYVWFDWTGATPSTNSSSGATYITYEELDNDWWRVSYTFTTAGAVTTHRVILFPESSAAATNSVYVWGTQLETGPWATSYIPTTTATVTKVKDVLYYAEANVDLTKGTMLATVTPWGSKAQSAELTPNGQIVVGTGGSGRIFYIRNSGTYAMYDGTTAIEDWTAYNAKTTVDVATSWGALGQRIIKAGNALNTGSFDGAMESANLYIGSDVGSAEYYYGNIKNLKLWETQLSDATVTLLVA